MHDSRVSRNTSHGLVSNSGLLTSTVVLSASNNIISHNGGAGIVVFGMAPGARVWASGNIVSSNGTGFWNTTGIFDTAGNNALRNNLAGGDVAGTILPILMR